MQLVRRVEDAVRHARPDQPALGAAEIADGGVPRWAAWLSLALAAVPIVLAGGHTVPSAVRLVARRDTLVAQSALARSICREHMLCFASIAALIALQLAAG